MLNNSSKVLIVGANGTIASLMIDIFYSMDINNITGIDKNDENNPKIQNTLKIDITLELDNQFFIELKKFDIIVFCIPFESFKIFFKKIMPHLNPNVIIIDVFSTKSEYFSFMDKIKSTFPRELNLISLHPLFRPDVISSERKILIYLPASKKITDQFVKKLEKQIRLVFIDSINDHDKIMSFLQVIPHFLTLVFSICLSESGVSYEKFKEFSTAFSEIELCLISRILSAKSLVSWEIQSNNSNAKEARKIFMEKFENLLNVIEDNEKENFEKKINNVQKYFKDYELYNQKFLSLFNNKN